MWENWKITEITYVLDILITLYLIWYNILQNSQWVPSITLISLLKYVFIFVHALLLLSWIKISIEFCYSASSNYQSLPLKLKSEFCVKFNISHVYNNLSVKVLNNHTKRIIELCLPPRYITDLHPVFSIRY